MKKTKYLLATFALTASSCVFANTAADNVRLSAAPPKDRVAGNECTNRSIQPFARPKDSTLSDDALRVALNVIKGAAGASDHMAVTSACGERSAL
jgi:hypothetical protein